MAAKKEVEAEDNRHAKIIEILNKASARGIDTSAAIEKETRRHEQALKRKNKRKTNG